MGPFVNKCTLFLPAIRILENSVRSSDEDLDQVTRDVFRFNFEDCEDIKKSSNGAHYTVVYVNARLRLIISDA